MRSRVAAELDHLGSQAGSVLAGTLACVFRCELFHTEIKAIVLFGFVDKKIFQNILAVCWCERLFADLAINQAVLT